MEEAAGIGFGLPCDIEGGAVVDAGADDGEAEGGIDGGVEGEGFEGDVALIVVHADDGVGAAASFREEGGIWRQGSGDADSSGGGGVDGWDDEAFLFLVSEEPVFSGVWVEPADGEVRGALADAGKSICGEFDDIEDAFHREESGDFVIADVGGYE